MKQEKIDTIKLTGQTEYRTIIFDFEDDENEYTVAYNEDGVAYSEDGDEIWTPVWDVRCDGEEVEENELRQKLIELAKENLGF